MDIIIPRLRKPRLRNGENVTFQTGSLPELTLDRKGGRNIGLIASELEHRPSLPALGKEYHATPDIARIYQVQEIPNSKDQYRLLPRFSAPGDWGPLPTRHLTQAVVQYEAISGISPAGLLLYQTRAGTWFVAT